MTDEPAARYVHVWRLDGGRSHWVERGPRCWCGPFLAPGPEHHLIVLHQDAVGRAAAVALGLRLHPRLMAEPAGAHRWITRLEPDQGTLC